MASNGDENRRGEQTKQRILEAARRRFSAEGYERTTIRAVAADADIDPSMRYFGSKEGLFTAAASFNLELPDLAAIPRKERGKQLVKNYLKRWEHDASLPVLLRTAAMNERAAERVREIFRQQVLPVISAASPDAAALRAGLIASQLLDMAYCRYIVKMPALVRMDAATLEANLGRTLQRYLDAPLAKD